MDNLLEYIVTLLFAAIYFFGNMFSKKSEDDTESPSRRETTPQEDPDALDRQRRIQDEIRRKIMERRGQETETRSQRAEAAPQATEVSQPEPVVARQETPVKSVRRNSDTATFSWDESDNAYGDQMASQLKLIEATKREAAKLQLKASQFSKVRDSKEGHSKSKRRSNLFSGSVRSSLRDPAAARAAFIYGEVLGQPVSMRKGSQVPGLIVN